MEDEVQRGGVVGGIVGRGLGGEVLEVDLLGVVVVLFGHLSQKIGYFRVCCGTGGIELFGGGKLTQKKAPQVPGMADILTPIRKLPYNMSSLSAAISPICMYFVSPSTSRLLAPRTHICKPGSPPCMPLPPQTVRLLRGFLTTFAKVAFLPKGPRAAVGDCV